MPSAVISQSKAAPQSPTKLTLESLHELYLNRSSLETDDSHGLVDNISHFSNKTVSDGAVPSRVRSFDNNRRRRNSRLRKLIAESASDSALNKAKRRALDVIDLRLAEM